MEVKSFTGASAVRELEVALRQFVLYGDALARVYPVRALYLAVREQAFHELFEEPLGHLLLESKRARLVVDVARREVVRWVR